MIPRSRLAPLALLFACSSAPPPPARTVDTAAGPTATDEAPADMSVQGAMGALDKEAVRSAAEGARSEATACIEAARTKLPYLGGDMKIFLTVDRMGNVVQADLLENDLGHLDTERCVLDAFRSASWPRPVGGEVGEVRQELGWDAGYDPVPEAWSSTDLREAMGADGGFDALDGALQDCIGEAAVPSIEVTMYLDEDGFVTGVGLGGAGATAAGTCVSTVVQTTSFPAPGKLVKARLEVSR